MTGRKTAPCGGRKIFSLPLYLPLALFFGGLLKVVLSAAVYFLFLALGAVVFRVRHGAKIRARLDGEAREPEEQRKKEELGHWR